VIEPNRDSHGLTDSFRQSMTVVQLGALGLSDNNLGATLSAGTSINRSYYNYSKIISGVRLGNLGGNKPGNFLQGSMHDFPRSKLCQPRVEAALRHAYQNKATRLRHQISQNKTSQT